MSHSDQIATLKILNTIAIQLNSVVDLNRALQLALTQTVELMGLQTGWIWLLHPDSNSVFLAASHQLPPAITKHPERLSGWCYCIDQYLANDLNSVANISEITCTRLKDLKEGTKGLRYHATVPLYDKEQKIGLLNLVSEKTNQLTAQQLELLQTIGTLLSTTIVRTRLFEKSKSLGINEERQRLVRQLKQGLLPTIEQLKAQIDKSNTDNTDTLEALHQVTQDLTTQTEQTLLGMSNPQSPTFAKKELQYPGTPLTKRELEVLEELKKGKTNKEIGTTLFISERTVKFHVSTMLSKLDAANRTDAVQIAMKRGLIQL